MNDPLEEQAIQDFLLESEVNLDTASRVTHAFPKVQLGIVQTTLDQLEAKIRTALGKDWQIWNNRNEVLLRNYARFSIWRESWGDICIGLETQTREETTTVGIWRKRSAETAVLDSALVEAFAKAKLVGDANRWWAWYQTLPPERGNWSGAAALAAMHFRRSEIVAYFAEQILLVHQIAAPVIDRFMTKR
jgi:hypothetical protein